MASDRWSLRNIYLYLVCLITLIMVIVAAVGFVRAIVDIAYPDPGYVSYVESIPTDVNGDPVYTEEQWAKYQADQKAATAASTRRYAVLTLVGNVAMLLIAGPLYVYHWKKIEVEHADKSEALTGAKV